MVFWACGDNPGGYDCDNGMAPLDQIVMPTDVYKNRSNSCIRGALGHELFHHIEFGYTFDGGGSGCSGTYGNTVCEGQARALQDKIYFDLDLDPAASCVLPYLGEVNTYLEKPDRTIWSASYGAALFWTYLMEQYGEFAFEPTRGIDFLVNWWDFAQAAISDPDVYQITENAIKVVQPTHSVLDAYHDFLIANVAKDLDLSSVSSKFRNRYSYRDEEVVPLNNNLMQYSEVAISRDIVVPFNGSTAPLDITAKRFGGKYFRFDTRACTAGRMLEFNASTALQLAPGPNQQVVPRDAMFSLIAVDSNNGFPARPTKLYKFRARNYSQSIPQPASRHDYVIAAVAGWHTDYAGQISMRCSAVPPPVFNLASTAHPLASGPPGSIGEFTARVPASTPATGIGTLENADFGIRIGAIAASSPVKLRFGADAADYRVLFPYPSLPPGTSDATFNVGTAEAQVLGGVRAAAHQPEILIAIDTTASMGTPVAAPRLDAVKAAARALVLGTPSSARMGLLRFAGNSATPSNNVTVVRDLAPLNAANASLLIDDLSGLMPSSELKLEMTPVLISSITQYDAEGAGGERHLVLITDSGDMSADIEALTTQARGAGVRVHVIALGGNTDQPAFARLAQQTGGEYHHVDNVAGTPTDPSPLLLPAVQKVREAAARMQATAQTSGALLPGTNVITLGVDPGVNEGPHVRVFNGGGNFGISSARLYRPDGAQVVAGPGVEINVLANTFAFRVEDGASGDWRLELDTSGAGGPPGSFSARAAVVDPARSLRLAFARPGDDNRSLDHFLSGEPVLVQLAVLDFDGDPPPSDAPAHAVVRSGIDVHRLNLNDQGQNGDQHAGDGVYSGLVRATDRGSPTGFDEDGSGMGSHGSYSVEAEVDFGTVAAPRILTTRGAFAVLREASVPDSDGDGLPDRYEARNACLDPATHDASADADGDGARTAGEYQAGSDPCDVDSDEGGEIDGSEIARGVSPVDASDDGVRRIRHIEIVRQLTDHEDVAHLTPLANTLRFSSDPAYAQVVIKRAPDRASPFVDIATISAAAANGLYIDANLVNGQTYCYQLVGRTAGGRVAAASDTVCGTARTDSTAPRGSIALNEGAPRASNPILTAQLSIDGEPAIGMEMSLHFPDGTDSGWIPFAPSTAVDASSLVVPSMATASVMFRDASGNESAIYTDDIEVISIAARGRILGATRVAAAFGGGPIDGVLVRPDAETAQPAESAPSGAFTLDNLPAGTYALTFERHGFGPRTIANIVLATGGTVDLGTVELIPQVLFRDSFE